MLTNPILTSRSDEPPLNFQLNPGQSPLKQRLPEVPTKARRWVGEMEEIAKTFRDLGLTPKTYQGTADVYRFVGKSARADETGETRDKDRTLAEMIEILAEG